MAAKRKATKKKRGDSIAAGFSFTSLMNMADDLDPAADQFLTVAEAARIRGTSRIAIHDLITRGRLRAITIAGRKFVSRDELEAFERAKPGPRAKGD